MLCLSSELRGIASNLVHIIPSYSPLLEKSVGAAWISVKS